MLPQKQGAQIRLKINGSISTHLRVLDRDEGHDTVSHCAVRKRLVLSDDLRKYTEK